MVNLSSALISTVATILLSGSGVAGVWWCRRHTDLSIRNAYAPATAGALLMLVAIVLGWWAVLLLLAPLSVPWMVAAGVGRRWRLSDLGAGEELRQHELERRWVWQPAQAALPAGERRWIGPQGQLIHQRCWPADVEYVSMTAQGPEGARLPIGDGKHVFLCGGTGAGKTTSARRLLAARTLAHGAAALLIDQKGDPADERELRRLAAVAGRPFVLFDPRDPERTDRWAPLWGRPGDVAARAVEAIKTSEPYYADTLRQHINLVVDVLFAARKWPPSFPFLVSAASARSWSTICAIAATLETERHAQLRHRVQEHSGWVRSVDGLKAIRGGLVRLELVMGAAWRDVLTPRKADEELVAVQLVEAIRAGAVVMWRTHADDMPDEAAAITVLAIADIYAAAGAAAAPWTLMLDEFGAVIHMAATRGISILQRARSHHGQVIVITQSIADIEALSQQPGLLGSLTDNFSAFVVHHQEDPNSRDWLAKLMGTVALWQHTDQTTAHGSSVTGQGSRRRVRQFRIGADEFARLGCGQAIVHTTLGPDPCHAQILPLTLPDQAPPRIADGPRHPCEIPLHPEHTMKRSNDNELDDDELTDAPRDESGHLDTLADLFDED